MRNISTLQKVHSLVWQLYIYIQLSKYPAAKDGVPLVLIIYFQYLSYQYYVSNHQDQKVSSTVPLKSSDSHSLPLIFISISGMRVLCQKYPPLSRFVNAECRLDTFGIDLVHPLSSTYNLILVTLNPDSATRFLSLKKNLEQSFIKPQLLKSGQQCRSNIAYIWDSERLPIVIN